MLKKLLFGLALWICALPAHAQYTISVSTTTPAIPTAGPPGFTITLTLQNGGVNFTPSCSPSCPNVVITTNGQGTVAPAAVPWNSGGPTLTIPMTYTGADTPNFHFATSISGSPAVGDSGPIIFSPAAYSKLVLLLPGENYSFSAANNKTGTATPQLINNVFNATIEALDPFGNLVPVNGGNATLTSSPPAGVIGGVTSQAFTNGIASFSISISTYYYNLSLTASDGVTPGITGQTDQMTVYGNYYFNVTVTNPVTAGPPATFPVTVELKDSGNPGAVIGNNAIPVPPPTLTYTINGAGTRGVISTLFNSNPITTPNQSYTQAGNFTLSVSAPIVPGRPNITGSTPLTVNPGPYSRTLLILPGEVPTVPGVPSATGKNGAPPAYIIENTPFGVPIQVRAADKYWNLVTGTGASAKLDTSPSGFISGAAIVPYDASGIASFAGIQVSTVGASVGIVSEDSVNGAILTNQDTLAVFPEPPIYTVTTPSVTTMTPAAFPLQVVLVGQVSGSTIPFATNSFNLTTISVTPPAAGSFTLGTLSGTLVGGVATITQTVSRTGTLKIQATDANPSFGFTGTSSQFNVIPEDHHYVVSAPPVIVFGVPFSLTISRFDFFNNPVTRNRNITIAGFYSGGAPIIAPMTIDVTSATISSPSITLPEAYRDPTHPLTTHATIYFKAIPALDGDFNLTPLATLATNSPLIEVSTGAAAGINLAVAAPFIFGSTVATVSATLVDGPEGHRIPGASVNFSLLTGVGSLYSPTGITDAQGITTDQVISPVAVSQGQVYIVRGAYNLLSSTVAVTLVLPPTTQLTTSGPALTTPDHILHVTSNTSLILTGITVGTIASITYNLDSTGNTLYVGPFTLPAGLHTLQFFSTDTAGQTGPTSSVVIQVSNGSFPNPNQLINYPNPFRAGSESTILEYILNSPSDLRLRIYTITGKLVLDRTIRQGENGTTPGLNQLTWDGRNGSSSVVASGGYVAVLEITGTGDKLVRKIAVVK